MVKASQVLDRVLVMEMVRVTEAAAVAASKLIGRGDEKAADHGFLLGPWPETLNPHCPDPAPFLRTPTKVILRA